MILVPAFLASLIPAAILFFWLWSRKGISEDHHVLCRRALIAGVLSTPAVIPVSAVLNLLGVLLLRNHLSPFVYRIYHDFMVLAFAEELVKFLAMKRAIRGRNSSWLEITIAMSITGLGFEVIEAIPYAIGEGPGPMIIRGVTLMHVAYGFVTGYYYGKARHAGKNTPGIGFFISWFLHGLYDFCLSKEAEEVSELFGVIALALAAFSVVLLFLLVRYVIRASADAEALQRTGDGHDDHGGDDDHRQQEDPGKSDGQRGGDEEPDDSHDPAEDLPADLEEKDRELEKQDQYGDGDDR